MTQRLRVGAREGLSTATADRGLARDFFIGGQQRPAQQFVPGTTVGKGFLHRRAGKGGTNGRAPCCAEAGKSAGTGRREGSDPKAPWEWVVPATWPRCRQHQSTRLHPGV